MGLYILKRTTCILILSVNVLPISFLNYQISKHLFIFSLLCTSFHTTFYLILSLLMQCFIKFIYAFLLPSCKKKDIFFWKLRKTNIIFIALKEKGQKHFLMFAVFTKILKYCFSENHGNKCLYDTFF